MRRGIHVEYCFLNGSYSVLFNDAFRDDKSVHQFLRQKTPLRVCLRVERVDAYYYVVPETCFYDTGSALTGRVYIPEDAPSSLSLGSRGVWQERSFASGHEKAAHAQELLRKLEQLHRLYPLVFPPRPAAVSPA